MINLREVLSYINTFSFFGHCSLRSLCGRYSLRGLAASLLAIPLVFLGHLIRGIHPSLFNGIAWASILLAVASMLIFAFIAAEDRETIVLNKVMGMLIALNACPLNKNMFVTAFILFHFVGFVLRTFVMPRLADYLPVRVANLYTVITIACLDIVVGYAVAGFVVLIQLF